MTFGLRNLVGYAAVAAGREPPAALLFRTDTWPAHAATVYRVLVGYHLGHALEFGVALLFYSLLWDNLFSQAGTLQWSWIARVVAFNLAAEVLLYGGWHDAFYSRLAPARLARYKYNPEDPYATPSDGVSTTGGTLQREMLFTTLGWLQSSAFQVVMMWLWASGRVPYLSSSFLATPVWSIGVLMLLGMWREFHLYVVVGVGTHTCTRPSTLVSPTHTRNLQLLDPPRHPPVVEPTVGTGAG